MSVALGDVCSFLNGGTPSRSVARYFEGDIPWITGADIVGPIVDSARSYITKEAVSGSATNLVPAGTILLVTRTSVGKVAVAGMPLCFSQDITALTADSEKIDTAYLVHLLRTKQPHFERLARGATIKGITREAIVDIRLELPPLPEQRRIADILDKADALRAKRRDALAQLDTLTQSIFLDMFGDPATNPKGWPVLALEDVAKTTSGGTPNREVAEYFGGGIPWVKSGELHQSVVTATEESLTDRGLDESSAKLMPAGTVLIAMYGATVGAVAVLGIEAATNQAICCVRPARELNTDYLVHLLRRLSPSLLAKRVGGAQPNLSQELLRRLRFPLPPLESQQAFTSRVSVAANLTTKYDSSLEDLNALFASLQHRAFRGEL